MTTDNRALHALAYDVADDPVVANRYIVERFQSRADGEIWSFRANGRSKSQRKQPRNYNELARRAAPAAQAKQDHHRHGRQH